MGEAYTKFIVTEHKKGSMTARAVTLFDSNDLESAEAFFETCTPNEETFFLLEELYVKTDRRIHRST